MLKVYMLGLLYFDGCDADERHVYAPNGETWDPPHYAGLWIEESLVGSVSSWWIEESHPIERGGETVVVRGFRVRDPARIVFPDIGTTITCDNLDTKLPKLRKQPDDDFEYDPLTADTIAEVTMHSGTIHPGKFEGRLGLVEWTISNHSALRIKAETKEGAELGTIDLVGSDAEVVFCNIHDAFEDVDKDPHAGNHISLFRKLNSTIGGAGLISRPPTGPVDPIHTDNAFIEFLRHVAHTEGETPPCCKP